MSRFPDDRWFPLGRPPFPGGASHECYLRRALKRPIQDQCLKVSQAKNATALLLCLREVAVPSDSNGVLHALVGGATQRVNLEGTFRFGTLPFHYL